ncbi:hypothetical protein WISP_56495 [Willisornis vidua]|uniref:Uncharacterized protein n=1 Tax=Willisornis vidua TaxID=1566151 RepID=A0ABQ9DHY0_9PASS|nr:hypothetical protein WISP_56495 [Willisornis vidua]
MPDRANSSSKMDPPVAKAKLISTPSKTELRGKKVTVQEENVSRVERIETVREEHVSEEGELEVLQVPELRLSCSPW